MAPTIVWFRRDLRLADHPARAEACGRGEIVPLFVHDPRLLSRRAAAREPPIIEHQAARARALRVPATRGSGA